MAEPHESNDSLLIVLDVPTGVEFGIDCITYETGPKFKGLSMVPTGLHFVYHGTGMGARQGFFIFVGNKDIQVKTWDSTQEEILPRHNLSEASLEGLYTAIARGELNSFLGPYPFQQHHTWKNVTNFITTSVLERSECPTECLLYPGDDSDVLVLDKRVPGAASGRPNTAESQALKAYFPDSARVARFVDLQRLEMELIEQIPAGKERAAAVTANMLDKSNLVEHLVSHTFNQSWADLLGEVQLSFVLFMLLYSHPALVHWKLMVYTISSSERYLKGNPHFTAAFLRVLFSQLNFAPTDFFENELSTQNFLRPTITALFASLSGPDISATLQEHKKRLRTFLQKKFNLYETELFTSVDAGGNQMQYEEEDLYNISEEDLPTFVNEEELSGLEQYASMSAGEYQSASVSMEGVGEMHISGDGRGTEGNTGIFNVREHAPVGAEEEAAFHQRWAAIDTALGGSGSQLRVNAGSTQKLQERSAAEPTEDPLGRLAPQSQPGTRAHITGDVSSIGTAESKSGGEDNASMDVSAHPGEGMAPLPAAPMSPAEKEAALFSWRYPMLYESMLLTSGREDMLMAAMRILEEGDAGGVDGSGGLSIATQRFKEAARFVEYEVGGYN